MRSSLAACALALLASAAAACPGGFEARCRSADDHGWPRFASRAALQADAKWSKYFTGVYGELPAAYPVCVFDLWFLDVKAYFAAGLEIGGGHPIIPFPGKPKHDGDLFYAKLSPVQLGIYHSQWAPVPNNTWVEVSHTVIPTELNGSWVWLTRGSNVWVNVGKTIVFPTPAKTVDLHKEAIAWARKGCSVKISYHWPLQESQIFGLCVREKGWNSVQFRPQEGEIPLGSFNLPGLTEMVLADMDGDKGCGVADAAWTPLRSGWNASRTCGCANAPINKECGLMAKPPPSILREVPPLCEVRAGVSGLFKSCNESTCGWWSCSANNSSSSSASSTTSSNSWKSDDRSRLDAASAAAAAAPLRPCWPWSWDTLPNWASGQGATDCTPSTTQFYTDNFQIMWTQGTALESHGWWGANRTGYATWEQGVLSDVRKVHKRRPKMPVFGYYGWCGCCSLYNNDWFEEFNSSALWLRDDAGRVVLTGNAPVCNSCSRAMLSFYKTTILKTFMSPADVHGSFFDECDSFVEGGGRNHPWDRDVVQPPYRFSAARKASVTQCFQDAVVEIIAFMTAGGKLPIPSTNTYQKQYPQFYKTQKDALVKYGGFKFVESFCSGCSAAGGCNTSAGSGGGWVCPQHRTAAGCCLDQLLSIKEHASLSVPLMVRLDLRVNVSAGSALFSWKSDDRSSAALDAPATSNSSSSNNNVDSKGCCHCGCGPAYCPCPRSPPSPDCSTIGTCGKCVVTKRAIETCEWCTKDKACHTPLSPTSKCLAGGYIKKAANCPPPKPPKRHDVVGWYVGTNTTAYPLEALFPAYTIGRLGGPLVAPNGSASCNRSDGFTAKARDLAHAHGAKIQWGGGFPAAGLPWFANATNHGAAIRANYMATIGKAVVECGVDGVEFDMENVGGDALGKAGIVTPALATEWTVLLHAVKLSIEAAAPEAKKGGSLVSCDVGAWGVTDGAYPLTLLKPWVNATMTNAGHGPDFVNTMSYHEASAWAKNGSIMPWEKDGFVAHEVWGLDKDRVNIGIPFFFFNFTGPSHTANTNEPTWDSLGPRCPNAASNATACNGIEVVSKEMARAIGAWVAAAGFRGVFPWAANYDSLRNNNSLIAWVNEGLGDLPVPRRARRRAVPLPAAAAAAAVAGLKTTDGYAATLRGRGGERRRRMPTVFGNGKGSKKHNNKHSNNKPLGDELLDEMLDDDPCASGAPVIIHGRKYKTKYLVVKAGKAGAPRVTRRNTKIAALVVGQLGPKPGGSTFWKSTGPFDYTYGASHRQLIIGFDVGSYGMYFGEQRMLCIPPAEGYGQSSKPGIPKGSTLVFTLTVDRIVQPPAPKPPAPPARPCENACPSKMTCDFKRSTTYCLAAVRCPLQIAPRHGKVECVRNVDAGGRLTPVAADSLEGHSFFLEMINGTSGIDDFSLCRKLCTPGYVQRGSSAWMTCGIKGIWSAEDEVMCVPANGLKSFGLRLIYESTVVVACALAVLLCAIAVPIVNRRRRTDSALRDLQKRMGLDDDGADGVPYFENDRDDEVRTLLSAEEEEDLSFLRADKGGSPRREWQTEWG